ncbi:MAG: isoprenylcysteine carboxylmethyltransferase family protein [Bacteroidota bacterium]
MENINQVNYIVTLGYVILCWIVFAISFLLREKPEKVRNIKSGETSKMGIIMVGIGFMMVFSFHRTAYTSILPSWDIINTFISLLTVVISTYSVWLLLSGVRYLGKQWQMKAGIVEHHQLITSGPYAIVRHPIYTGMLGMLMATGLAMTTFQVFVYASIIAIIGTLLRLQKEEILLHEQFGEKFEKYAASVPTLFPFMKW